MEIHPEALTALIKKKGGALRLPKQPLAYVRVCVSVLTAAGV